jgi:hypothetical protein
VFPSLLSEYHSKDIFNADECGLFYNLLLNTIHVYAFESESCHRGPYFLSGIPDVPSQCQKSLGTGKFDVKFV